MDADLDLLLTTVFVTADDLLPERQKNAARRVTDAEVVTLCVAQAIMGIPSDRRFLAVAGKRLGHLFRELPKQPGYFKRRRRLADTLEWLMGIFASQSPGFYDDLLLIDSTPVECARSRETTKRSALGDAADYHVRRSLPADPEPDHGQRLVHAFAQRAGGAGVSCVRARRRAGELLERARVVGLPPCLAEPGLDRRRSRSGRCCMYVALLVPQTPLYRTSPNTDRTLCGVLSIRRARTAFPALIEPRSTRSDSSASRRRVLRPAFPQPERIFTPSVVIP